MWKYFASTFVAGSVAYSLYRYFAGSGVCKCSTRLDGLVIVITGANKGIGKALAFELAQRGATLVLGCRDTEKGVKTKRDILTQLNNKNIQIFVKELDLASISSILRFTNTLTVEFSEIYALVNNAGIFYYPHTITEDEFELTYQTNYLGHFILTHHLLNLLKSSDHARIINVTSATHKLVNSYDLNAISKSQTEFRSHLVAYGVSKLALILFTRHLAQRLNNTNILVNSVDPGKVDTDLYRHFFSSSRILYFLQWPIRFLLFSSPQKGVQTLLHSLLTSNRSTGQLYVDCKLSLPSKLASDPKLSKEFYNLTLEILGDRFNTESTC